MTKSLSSLANVLPCGRSTCRDTLRRLNWHSEEVVAILGAERVGLVALQSARRRRAHRHQRRHQLAGARMAVEHAVLFAVHAAVDGVDESVAAAVAVEITSPKESARLRA